MGTWCLNRSSSSDRTWKNRGQGLRSRWLMTTVIVGIRVRFLGAPGEEFSKVDLSHVASMVPYYQGVGVEGSASSFAMQVVSTIFLAVYTQV